MPKSWHMLKCVLLKEIATAETYNEVELAIDALFHARLLAENCKREIETIETKERAS
jgi:hypothetical protein